MKHHKFTKLPKEGMIPKELANSKKAAPDGHNKGAGKPAPSESKAMTLRMKPFSERKHVIKKTENDVTPAGGRPNTLRSKKVNAKKLDDIRI